MHYLPSYPIFTPIAARIRLNPSTDFYSSVSRAAPVVPTIAVTEIVMDPTLLISLPEQAFSY
jgi:hypothetical protein